MSEIIEERHQDENGNLREVQTNIFIILKVIKTYYNNGTLKEIYEVDNQGRINGVYNSFRKNGQIERNLNYLNDQIISGQVYNENNRIIIDIRHIKNTETGKEYSQWVHYANNGNILRVSRHDIKYEDTDNQDLPEIKNQRAEKAFLEQIKSREIKNNILKEQINSKEK